MNVINTYVHSPRARGSSGSFPAGWLLDLIPSNVGLAEPLVDVEFPKQYPACISTYRYGMGFHQRRVVELPLLRDNKPRAGRQALLPVSKFCKIKDITSIYQEYATCPPLEHICLRYLRRCRTDAKSVSLTVDKGAFLTDIFCCFVAGLCNCGSSLVHFKQSCGRRIAPRSL